MSSDLRFRNPDRIRFDAQCFQIDGRDTFLYSGAFHYFRCPKAHWQDRFRRLADGGFNCVETYVPWNYHERHAPASVEDTSKIDLTELDEWMHLAHWMGLHTIIRPGPYICAEWSGGGYPQWLVPLFKPATWPKGKQWLQTDDPKYLAWNKHWYDAVARVVGPHQITRTSPGVVMWQIENEYERLKWIPTGTKARHLAAIAKQSREAGIDVPIVTCWTKESRSSPLPDLHGVFDFSNFYPKWEVEKKLRDNTAKVRADQPYAPIATMELQGGWYAAVGGALSHDIDGVQPVQTQNLALYCVQLGYTVINYYMLVGGTNFDDWASREATTTYDFFAPVREHGGVGEKYRRVAAIGRMLKEHGEKLTRSIVETIDVTVSDDRVQTAVRRASDGTRYVFIRTEDRTADHRGTVMVTPNGALPITFDFSLERFGSKVFVLPPNARSATEGKWYPEIAHLAEPATGTKSIPLRTSRYRADAVPTQWQPLAVGESLESCGVVDHHTLYYRITPKPGVPLVVEHVTDKMFPGPGDGVLALANGVVIKPASEEVGRSVIALPAVVAGPVTLLFESAGLHHHTTVELENQWRIGPRRVTQDSVELPLEYARGEGDTGIAFSRDEASPDAGWSLEADHAAAPVKANALLHWFRLAFDLPPRDERIWVPWHLHLDTLGSGFVYLNGRCLGRTWEIGPQRDFYLPECWLNFGARNVLAIGLRPVKTRVAVRSAAVVSDGTFAERRALSPSTFFSH